MRALCREERAKGIQTLSSGRINQLTSAKSGCLDSRGEKFALSGLRDLSIYAAYLLLVDACHLVCHIWRRQKKVLG